MLPQISTREEFKSYYEQDDVWLNGLETIVAKHDLQGALTRGRKGSGIIYRIGEDLWIKLVHPIFEDAFATERACLKELKNKLSVRVPELVCEGHIEGYDYLIFTHLPGERICDAWYSIHHDQREALSFQMGKIVRELGQQHVFGLPESRRDGRAMIENQFDTYLELHRPHNSELWLKQFESMVNHFIPEDFVQSQFVHGDLTWDHFLVEQKNGVYQITGLLDFADARMACLEYELVAPFAYLLRAYPKGIREFWRGLEFKPTDAHRYGQRLMAMCLLHKFSNFPKFFEYEIVAGYENLEDLAMMCFGQG